MNKIKNTFKLMVRNHKCQAHNIHKDMWFLKIIWEYTSTKV